MRRVVLDTNVLISAFALPSGTPGNIYALWKKGQFTLVTSEYILDEFVRIAKVKLHFVDVELHPLRELFYLTSEIVEPVPVSCAHVDEQDLPLLGTAISGAADVLVTGDRAVLALKRFQSIPILSPREFLDAMH